VRLLGSCPTTTRRREQRDASPFEHPSSPARYVTLCYVTLRYVMLRYATLRDGPSPAKCLLGIASALAEAYCCAIFAAQRTGVHMR
jgi:hypothetical protein